MGQAGSENESQAWVTITVTTVATAVALTVACLRFFTRAVLIKQFGSDDWAALVAMIFGLACSILVAANIKNGLGRHSNTLSPIEIERYFKLFYMSIVFYNLTLTSVKLTFLLLYYRVFAVKKMRKVLIWTMIVVGCWCVSQLLVAIFTCSPIHRFWKPEVPGTCIPSQPFWYINAAGNLATDMVIFLMPIPMLSSLKLRRTQKLLLIGIFSLGFFTCTISVIRFQYLQLDDDVTYENVASSSWSVGEICSAIICACLPTLRPLLHRVVPGLSKFEDGSGQSSERYYWAHRGEKFGSRQTASYRRQSATAGSEDQLYRRDLEAGSCHRHRGHSRSGTTCGSVNDDMQLRMYRTNSSELLARPDPAAWPLPERREEQVQTPELLGLRSTVITQIGVGPSRAQNVPKHEIEVQRDLVQTESERRV